MKGVRASIAASIMAVSFLPITLAAAAPPSNDAIASATVVTSLPFTDEVDTTEATLEFNDPGTFCFFPWKGQYGATVWYKRTPSSYESIVVDTLGSDFDTFIDIWSGDFASGSQEHACNDDMRTMDTLSSRTKAILEPGVTYYFQIGGLEAGDFGGPQSGSLVVNMSLRKITPGVVRGNTWYLNGGFDGLAEHVFAFGSASDKFMTGPRAGRFGDGVSSPWVRRGNVWYPNENFDAAGDFSYAYGSASDTPVLGDWKTLPPDDQLNILGVWPGVVRGNVWYLNDPGPGDDIVFTYGRPTDIKLVGDWNRDGVDTPVVVRGNRWLFTNIFSTGPEEFAIKYGLRGDRPIVGDWNGDGMWTPGIIRGNTWYLNNGFDGTADVVFSFGRSTDKPIVGDWDGYTSSSE